jgi:predicted aspartyl protease
MRSTTRSKTRSELWLVLCVAGQLSLAQIADTSLTKDQVLDRWAAALGGRDKLEHIHTIHTRGSVETGGMQGTFERWSTWRGEFRMALDFSGAIHQVNIFDAKQGWAMDANGAVHQLSGGNLRSAASSAYEASDSFLFPGRLPGVVVFSGRDANQSAYVIRLEPEGGNPVTVFLDDNTFLPKREETAGPLGNPRSITISAWREFAGIKVPARVIQSTGDPKFDIATTTEQVEINPPLAAELFTKPAETAAQVRFTNGAHQAVIPVEVYGQHVFVPVRVNGTETAWFFLDSGAGGSVVTKAWAQKIGLSSEGAMRAVGAAGATSLALAKNVVLNLPGVELPMPSVTVLDTAAGFPPLGRSWDGLLGYDVLSRLVVRVDYEHKEITIIDPAVFRPSDHAAALPLTFLGNWPLVPAKMVLPGREPIETKCFIDSGAGGLMLATPFTNANHVLGAATKTVSTSIYGAGGESQRFEVPLAGLQLGPYLLRNPAAGFSPTAKEGALASPDIGAIIGGEILQRFTVTFDYPHERILLEPNSSFGPP